MALTESGKIALSLGIQIDVVPLEQIGKPWAIRLVFTFYDCVFVCMCVCVEVRGPLCGADGSSHPTCMCVLWKELSSQD